MPQFGDYQNEIYFNGLSGVLPKFPVDFATLQERASAALAPAVLNYLQGGCGDEHTQRINADAFQHWGMVPRMMVDTTNRDLSISLFGMKLPTPLFMCPVGIAGICTQDGYGDLAAAGAAAQTGVPPCPMIPWRP
jgi:lactate 2-monooxygenase